MNVLLVDDDRFVVAALLKKINWNALSVTHTFTAYNIRQAQKIMDSNTIHICVCDIEMPGGSGLDFLSWVREQEFSTQFIFLTSYSDFSYAQKAIALSSMDYQLKPIDFEKLFTILEKAVQKVQDAEVLDKTKNNSDYWTNNYQTLVDLFWKDLFLNPLMRESSVLEKKLKQISLTYEMTDRFLPILLKLYPDTAMLREMDSCIIDFSFHNIASETLQNVLIFYESIITLPDFEYVLIIGNIQLDDVKLPLTENLKKLFDNLQKFLKCNISCCVSPEVPMTELPSVLETLRKMRENTLSQVNIPLFSNDYIPKKITYSPPSLDVIRTFLEQKNASAALKNLEHYLDLHLQKKEVNKELLLHLRLDIEQLVFAFLQANGIEAHALFSTEETNELISKSTDSAVYMQDYFSNLIVKAVNYSSFIKEEDSVIDIILNYIHQHYSEDITRNMLADLVYLNPDYMARLFKNQTHTSIVNYITEYRIQKAKELLNNPDIPIGMVASKVGYGNYSYFSKLFKDITGCTPNEYRKKNI